MPNKLEKELIRKDKINEKLKTVTDPNDIEFIQMLSNEVFVKYPEGDKYIKLAGEAEHELIQLNTKLLAETEFGKSIDKISSNFQKGVATQEEKAFLKSPFLKENRPKVDKDIYEKQMIANDFINKNLIDKDYVLLGEEPIKKYGARNLYKHYEEMLKIVDSNEPFDSKNIATLKKEYDEYKKETATYIKGLDLVKDLFKDVKYYSGNMDVSRTPGMPEELILRYEEVSILNSIWMANVYAKSEGLDFVEVLNDPAIIFEKALDYEKTRLNKMFDGKTLEERLIKTLDHGITFSTSIFGKVMAVGRAYNSSFYYSPNVEANRLEKAYNGIIFSMSNYEEDIFRREDSPAKNAYISSYLYAKESDYFDPNIYLKKMDFDFETLTVKKYTDENLFDMAESLREKNGITNAQFIQNIRNLEKVAKEHNLKLDNCPRKAIFRHLNNAVLKTEKTNDNTNALILEAKRLSFENSSEDVKKTFNDSYPDTFIGNLKYLTNYSSNQSELSMAM